MITRAIHVSELAPLLAAARIEREDWEDVANSISILSQTSRNRTRDILHVICEYHYGLSQRQPRFTVTSKSMAVWMEGVFDELQQLEL